MLAVQGPNATKILQALTDINILNLKYYTFEKGLFAGVENVLISATGYTGAGGVEIYFENKDNAPERIWKEIFRVGEPEGLNPIAFLRLGDCVPEVTLPISCPEKSFIT